MDTYIVDDYFTACMHEKIFGACMHVVILFECVKVLFNSIQD